MDLPESASVANLKKAVMDAAMNLLGGGLRVRVLMQGKKVPDEAATLSQMGISRNAKPDSLGFMLEPSPVPTSASATAEDPLLVLSRAAHQPSPRYSFDWSSFINFNAMFLGCCILSTSLYGSSSSPVFAHILYFSCSKSEPNVLINFLFFSRFVQGDTFWY